MRRLDEGHLKHPALTGQSLRQYYHFGEEIEAYAKRSAMLQVDHGMAGNKVPYW